MSLSNGKKDFATKPVVRNLWKISRKTFKHLQRTAVADKTAPTKKTSISRSDSGLCCKTAIGKTPLMLLDNRCQSDKLQRNHSTITIKAFTPLMTAHFANYQLVAKANIPRKPSQIATQSTPSGYQRETLQQTQNPLFLPDKVTIPQKTHNKTPENPQQNPRKPAKNHRKLTKKPKKSTKPPPTSPPNPTKPHQPHQPHQPPQTATVQTAFLPRRRHCAADRGGGFPGPRCLRGLAGGQSVAEDLQGEWRGERSGRVFFFFFK